jgi:quercetin dioxygenase-like cupin family protein
VTIFRQADAAFWASEPEFLRPLQTACGPFGLQIRHFVMGDPNDANTPTAAVLKMPPGYVLPRHAHPCERLEVIVAGTLQVDDDVLVPGDVMATPAGEMHGPHVAGPDGCTTVEVFSSVTGNGNIVLDTEDGPRAVSYR